MVYLLAVPKIYNFSFHSLLIILLLLLFTDSECVEMPKTQQTKPGEQWLFYEKWDHLCESDLCLQHKIV